MLTAEQKYYRDAIAAHDWDSEVGGPPFYDGGDIDDQPVNMRLGLIAEGRRLSKITDDAVLVRDDAYSLRTVYLTFCEGTAMYNHSHKAIEYPKVIGEYSGVFVVQTSEVTARLFDVTADTVHPEGSLQPILARAPYEPFDDKDGNVLALFKDFVKDE